jgi:LysM repeat protein
MIGNRSWRRGVLALGTPLLAAGIATAGAPTWAWITVKPGDTLTAIAARYHTTVARLVQANNLPGNGNVIYAGSRIKVPAAAGSGGSDARTTYASYRVRPGDTVIGLAGRYHVPTNAIVSANHLAANGMIRIGQVLRIPVPRAAARGAGAGASSSNNTFAGRTYPNAVVARAALHRSILASRSLPSRAGIRSIIAATARQQGVSPSLALAVAYQESGFNPRVVSVADAIGAMQVIPSTGTWASAVVGRQLDLLNPYDNATAGVLLLRVLVSSASSTEQAIAGYYQGLASVRRNGMYADTKQYVANVLALRASFAT